MIWLRYIRVCLCLLTGIVLMGSCVKDQDFSQVDEFEFSPKLELALAYYDYKASDWGKTPGNDLNGEIYLDSTSFDLFSSEFFKKDMEAATFYLKHINTIPRSFESVIIFYDSSYNVLRESRRSIPAYTSGDAVVLEDSIVFDSGSIEDLKNTAYLTSEITLIKGNPLLTEDSQGSVRLQSRGVFTFRFNE